MKKFFGIGKKKKSGPSPSPSESGSVLSVGYELKDKDLSKLHRATSAGDVPKIRQLLHKQDINQVDKENRTPLHLACANGHLDAVRLLVESKAKLNLCDNDSRTPLFKSIQCQHEHCATVLLEHDADPNVVDVNGNSAFHLAALIPSLAIANQLLEHGANINTVNKDGCTPLVLAATENHEEMVEFLIKEGADVNSKDKNGRTSLMVAAGNGQISLVKYLLQNNADIFVKDETGWTADDHAVMNGHHACSHLIIEHGSKNKRSSLYSGGKKGTSVFNSPDRVVEGGFALGSPAINKEELQVTSKQKSRKRDSEKGTDDFSQGDSESHVSGKADSWPSSDEDDLDFSPKITSKPNLTQLLSSKKKVNESFALQSKSDSDEDSFHDSEDEDANIPSPPKTVPEIPSFPQPLIFSPGSFTKPSQLASASLHSIIKEKSFSSDEGEDDNEGSESSEHSFTANTAGQARVQAGGDVGRKVVLMSELGLEDDDVESPWDSESASDSPRKQSTSDMPTPAAPVHMQCISEESHGDMHYRPCFLKHSRSCKMQDEDWLYRQSEVSEKSTSLGANKPQKTVLQMNNGSSTNSVSKINERNSKSDLMADLGLDDADDIEDASDWDSTSHSLKYSSHTPRSVAQSHHKLNESTSPQTILDSASAKGTAASLSVALSSVQEDDIEEHVNLKKDSAQSISKDVSQDLRKREHGLPNGKTIIKDQSFLMVEREKTNINRQLDLEKSKRNCDTENDLQEKSHIQPKITSESNSYEGKNFRPSIQSGSMKDDDNISKVQKQMENGDVLKGLDGQTLSETSQKPGKRAADKPVDEKSKDNDDEDMDDFSQSSGSVTEEYEVPTSAFRNAMLLIEQLNLEGQDSVNVLKMQNIIHEYERVIEKENQRHVLLAQEVKKLREERKEIQQMTEKNRELKSLLEYNKVEWDSDISSLRSSLKQEEEKRKSAEMLHDMSKEQFRRKEEQCRHEIEEKQQLELTLRNLELEMRSLRNSMKQVEEERNESQRLHTQEHNARLLQEEALNNLRRRNEEEDNKKRLAKSVEQVQGEPSETNVKVKDLTQKNITLEEEIYVLKQELEQVRSRYQEEESRYLDENECLKEKNDDLRKDLKVNEETLTQTVIQCNAQLNALKTETNLLCSKLEHEKQGKERLETELESVRSRLNSALQDLERSQISKTDAERTLQRERDDWLRSKDKLNHDLSSLRESHNNLSQQLSRAEAKSNTFENDLHRTGLSLQEKTLLFESSQRDLKEAQNRIKDLERSVQVEKDQTNKSSIKQETMQERLAQITSENMQLRQQLEEAQNKGIIKEKAVCDVQDRFTDIFSKLRTDTERQVQIVEERNKDLINKSNELREQIYRLETEKVERESSIRQLQQELADALKKLSMSEASLEVITRYRNDLEEEKQHLHKELERFRTKIQDLEEQFLQSERRNHQLKNLLDDKEREVIAAFQKVQELSSATAGSEKSAKQLEEHIQKLEIENAKIEATAKQQSVQIETLQKELQESICIRNRLEDLVTGLQTSKFGLEEKLNLHVHKQTVLSQNAQDSHNLWEEELKSRSRLGVRLAELDRSKADLVEQVESEKKKVRKLLDQKKSMEERFDQEMKRNNDLQREVSGLKKLLKATKKKLKDFENGQKQPISMKEGSYRGSHETDSDVLKLKEKIEELSSNLERESRKYIQFEASNRDLHEQLSSMKASHKNHDRLERSKRQLEEEVAELRRHIGSSKMDQSYMEQYKRELDERSRQELRQKLEEVNMFLQAQAASKDKLEQLRAENDTTVKNQLDHRIQDLESELNKIKNKQEENMSQKDSSLTELTRIKDMYAEEQKTRKSLASKLERANERLAEVNAKLLNERQRSKSLFASSFLNGSLNGNPLLDTSSLGGLGSNPALTRSLGLGGSFLNPVGSGFSANEMGAYFVKMQQELEKNITKELDQANAELDTGCARVSPVGSTGGSMRNLSNDQDLVSQARQQYLEVLKKNYKI
ncbi:ankyrin repeat domain-containing protein 26-like isoform X3 [Rana temporaria]|uniref:ankyrin repeat domain-containing protein 26-like isoform X3 n=1 Tax=Rana temporaria TaxID=8407 RepID=UPI001AADED25|nr:ankyrin repeat domain-containing protein 26-like isoform X3 [Rana temporaria]